MNRYVLIITALLLLVTSSSCHSRMDQPQERDDRTIVVDIVPPTTPKSIYRDPKSLSVVTAWEPGFFDLDLFIRQDSQWAIIKAVEIMGYEMSKNYYFQLTLPEWIDIDQEYSIMGVIAEHVLLKDNYPLVGVGGRLMYELVKDSPNSDRYAPVYFDPISIKGKPSTPLTAKLKHLGSIAVITLKNSATEPLTTAGLAIVPEADERPFYHEAALPFAGDMELPYINPLALNDPPELLQTSVVYPSTTFAPGEVKSLGFWFRPLGIETPALRLAMYEVSKRQRHLSTTAKPAKEVQMTPAHAYHFFAEWNGKELSFLESEPKP